MPVRYHYHYEFKDWKQAFVDCRKCISEGVELRLVVSTHHMTSGYWLEEDIPENVTTPTDIIYRKDRIELFMLKVEKELALRDEGLKERGLILL